MSDTGLLDIADEVASDLDVVVRDDSVEVGSSGDRSTRPMWMRSSLTSSAASRLVGNEAVPGLVIADRIDSAAEHVLRGAGWSYWDRRGRLRLWLPEIGVRLDVPTRSHAAGSDGPDPRRPVAGVGGISVAVGLLDRPGDPPGVREIARLSDMAPSTISRARRHLTQVALVDSDGAPVVPELFWATSDAWVVEPVSVDTEPTGDGWALGGDGAAARWAAPVLGTRKRFYCADPAMVDRHRLRHRADSSPIQVAVAPTPLAITSAINGVVRPLVAALDLSTSARGRAILDDWATIDPELPGVEVVWR